MKTVKMSGLWHSLSPPNADKDFWHGGDHDIIEVELPDDIEPISFCHKLRNYFSFTFSEFWKWEYRDKFGINRENDKEFLECPSHRDHFKLPDGYKLKIVIEKV